MGGDLANQELPGNAGGSSRLQESAGVIPPLQLATAWKSLAGHFPRQQAQIRITKVGGHLKIPAY